MDIRFLADCPDVIPAIACLHQLELRLGDRSAQKYYSKVGWTVIDITQPQGFPESVVMQKLLVD